METMCGGGAACERWCPVMKAGRVCPKPEELLAELSVRGVDSGAELVPADA